MEWVLVIVGALLVGLVARDMFHQVLHPTGRGALSRVLMRAVFALARRLSRVFPSLVGVAGPLGLLATIVAWVALLAVGFALIYLPYLPGSFLLATGLTAAGQGSFPDALYLSLVTLATLGFGDITPLPTWLRMCVTLEALLGFALLTASLSWALSLYPVLARRRALAEQVSLLAEEEGRRFRRLLEADPATAAQLLWQLAGQVAQLRSDLLQFPSSLYFHAPERRASAALALVRLRSLQAVGTEGGGGPAEAAALLGAALDSVNAVLGDFGALPEGADEPLRRYARLHLRVPPGH